ncbi:conjugal transfer protein TraG N-terminal domain-containing protein [Burkholderia cenocepacia]|uniref:Conjugal transfer protein TraG N-terminal domain-containing protein n=1 Tax=Burkholderia cenocepacia TaxID=95486 RepID=A0AAW4TJZ7_9BURK|nr:MULTISPECIES: conjugal transfer protein TraG N-terminal domain-containing protein [Burkholderia cepacia complex]MCA8383524.1 conjugal transfer protein TraG N-terminal domain-containing protein [Burkholderia cenocepacia]MDN7534036.1 conjugal transfer protein TraG N-terminal domain-containing protein [Burkholderia orbicola]
MNMEIDTYGNVDTLYYVMQGIASFMGSGTWTGLIRYTLLCGVVIWTIVAIGRKGYEIFRWFAAAMLMTQLLLLPVENVFVTDVNNVQPTREVDHVPVYLAAVAQSFTLISRVLTQSYETIFSVPDTLTLKKGDVGFGISVLQKVNKAEITDPGLHADLIQFFKECTVYDIQDGAIDPKTIMSGTDPFNTVFTSTSPARYVTTNTLTANPTTDTCSATGTLLLLRVQDAEQAAEQMYGSEMYPEIADPSMAKAEFVNAIGDSYGFILQSSQNASSALRQAMFNNVWRQAGAELPAMLSDPARVAEVNALMSSAQAAVATNGSLASMAILAKNTLPTVRNYAEAIIYAVFPLILVLCLISGADGAKRILAMYAKTVAWVSIWPMLFAVINGLSLIHLSHEMRSMSLQAGVPFGMAAKFGQTLLDEQALLGYMVIITPPLAWMLLNFASAGVVGAFSQLSGALTGSAQQIGGQQAQGDENIGNVHMDSSSIDNASRNVTSANKYDNTVQSRTGSMNVDTGTGSAFTNFANGLIARTEFQNSLGVSATSQDAFERSLGTDTSTGVAANRTNSTFAGREQLASSTNSVSSSQERGSSQRLADEASSGTRASSTQSGERRTSNDQQYSVDQAHSVEGQTSLGGRGSIMLGGGFDKAFGDDAQSAGNVGGGGGGSSGGNGRGPSGNGSRGTANSSANSPLFNQAEEDRLARKAESLGKTPQEVQAVRDAYRSKVRAADFVNGGGTGKGRSSLKFGLDVSGEGGYTRFWRNSDAQKFVDQYGSLGAYTESDQFSREGSQVHSDSTGMESGQHVRSDRSASLTDQVSSGSRVAADLTRSADVRQRGSTQVVSRVDTSTNLMTPENLQAVAARNGMRYSQLMTLPSPQIAQLVAHDAAMRDIVSRNSTLPTTARDGSALPASGSDVARQDQRNQSGVGASAPASFQRFAGAVGPVDTTPLDVATPMPQIVTDAQQRVAAMQQRVASESAAPIKQVRDHVDPTADNKPLMMPERAPGRSLSSPPAATSASDSKGPLSAWVNSIQPTGPVGTTSTSAPIENFLHPRTTGNGPTLEAARAAEPGTGSPATQPRLSESDFRIVTLPAGNDHMSHRQSDRRAPDALDGTYSRPSPELSSPDREAVGRAVDPIRGHRMVDDGSQGRGVPTASMKRSGGVSVVAPRTTAVSSGSRIDNVKPTNAGPVGATPAPTAPGTATRSSSTSGGVGLPTVESQVGGVERKVAIDRAPAGPSAAGAVLPTTPSSYPDPATAEGDPSVPRDESAASGAATSPSALVSPSRLGRGSADDERGVKSIPRADVANDDPKNQ